LQCPVVGELVNWKGFGRKWLWSNRNTSIHLPRITEESTNVLSQVYRCPCLDSNRAPSWYKSGVYPNQPGAKDEVSLYWNLSTHTHGMVNKVKSIGWTCRSSVIN
jgi:hypothetical protein